jgi:hypothetical protein
LFAYVDNDPVNWVDPLGQWRLPDFISFNVNVAIPTPWTGTALGWSGTAIVDRYGNWYWSPLGGGVGKALSYVSGSLTANWMDQGCKPCPPQLKNMLTSHGFNAAVGKWGGITEFITPGVGSATGVGIVTPQIGGSYNYSFAGPGSVGPGW